MKTSCMGSVFPRFISLNFWKRLAEAKNETNPHLMEVKAGEEGFDTLSSWLPMSTYMNTLDKPRIVLAERRGAIPTRADRQLS